MIRRVFWLTVGAAGGIMGYRRVAALGRRVSGKGGASGTGGASGNASVPGMRARRRGLPLAGTIRAARAVHGFSRDVREGMEIYSARRPRGVGPTLPESNDNDLTVKDDR